MEVTWNGERHTIAIPAKAALHLICVRLIELDASMFLTGFDAETTPKTELTSAGVARDSRTKSTHDPRGIHGKGRTRQGVPEVHSEEEYEGVLT